MVFSSPVFLFLFLPFVLLVNFILPKKAQNLFLLLCSLFFYAWGEGELVFLMLFSIGMNYIFGVLFDFYRKKGFSTLSNVFLILGVSLNIGLLVYFKYFNFILENIQALGYFKNASNELIHLPIGISFFTFQSISYLVDIQRKEVDVQKNPLNLGLYISLFPQLIAGPIVRYHDVATQINNRIINSKKFYEGIIRFVRGLAKKLLIANSMGAIADSAFAMSTGDLPSILAWLGIICYAFQIYFDFSGYSDMAIGLGKMLGFDFLENFNYPYISKSIQEFWRRWHISLSSWFKDYLYIPLGGNRKGVFNTYRNLLLVFFITGVWHGASWNFIIWGMFHGAFLILERMKFNSILTRLPVLFQHFYTMLVVLVGWVFFRADDLSHSYGYLQSMFSMTAKGDYKLLSEINSYNIFIFVIAIIFSTPVSKWIVNKFENKKDVFLYSLSSYVFIVVLLVLCIMEIASNSYNPFIYFRF